MKKVLTITILALIAIMLIIFIANVFYVKREYIDLSYGDNFPNIKVYSSEKKITYITQISNKKKIIFYLSSSCEECIKGLVGIKRMIDIIISDDFDYILLWKESIPEKNIAKYDINKNSNFSLNNSFSLSRRFPTAFILDENGKVLFTCSNDYDSIVYKIWDMVDDKNASRSKAFSHILKEMNIINKDIHNSKELLLYFKNENCEMCKVFDEILETKDKINVNNLIILTADNNILNKEDETMIDFYNIYGKIFDINKYPCIITIDENGQLLKTIKSAQELEGEL